MTKTLTVDSLVTLVSDIWMSTSTLKLAIRWHLPAFAFKKFSENQSNILCKTFSKIGIISGRKPYGVGSSAKLALF